MTTRQIPERLKKLRTDRAMSRYAFGELTGHSGNHIRLYEEGIQKPCLENLIKIAHACGLKTLDYFLED